MGKFVESSKQNLYGYARVSTKEQNTDRQIQALKEFGIEEENIFEDKKSGKDFNREEYQLLKRILKRTTNNVLVIKSIDRLGRNYKEIQNEWREITQDLKTDIVVLDMEILDTRKYKNLLGNFIADLVLQVLSFVAEQERINTKQRQEEGIKIAKSKNVKFGRPRIERPHNFEEEYNKWKKGEQTAKTTMDNSSLKRNKFYMFVKEYQERELKKIKK